MIPKKENWRDNCHQSKRHSPTHQALLLLKKEGWGIIKLGKVYAGEIIERTIDLSKIEK